MESPAPGEPESRLVSSNQDTLNYTVIVVSHNVAQCKAFDQLYDDICA